VRLVLFHAWDETRLPLMEQLRDEFQRRHPPITVDFDLAGSTAQGMTSPRVQKLVAAVAGGAQPDVAMIWRGEVPALALQGVLQPLDQLIARDKFDPKIYYEAEWATSRYQNKTYVLPSVSAGGWFENFYNRDHLREAGYGPDQAPATWHDATSALSKLTKIEGGRITRLGGDRAGGVGGFILYALNNKGKYLSDDGSKALFDGPEGNEALEWWQGFWEPIGGPAAVDAFAAAYATGAANAPFTVGAKSMQIQNPSQIFFAKQQNPTLDFGVAVPPHGPRDGDGRSYIRGGWSYGIPSGVQHPAEAWLLVQWLSATKEAAGWFMQQQLRPSPLREVNEDKYYSEKLPVAWPQLLKAMQKDVAVPITPVDGEIDRVLNQLMTDVGAKTGPVRDLLRQAAADVQRELDTFWARRGK
jgi:ABC-type glycerol-3-phosphate transport system substrate-binding protein